MASLASCRASCLALAALAALLPGGLHAQTVLVENFELPDTPNYITFTAGQSIVTATNTWNVTVDSVDLFEDAARTEAAAYDGAQAVDLTGSPGAGVMEVVFATAPGETYRLVFHYARNALLGAETGDAQVEVVGTGTLLDSTVQHDPAQHAFDAYLEFDDTFTADAAQATLRFTSLDPGTTGITIDGIEISVVSSVGVGESVTCTWGRAKGMFRD